MRRKSGMSSRSTIKMRVENISEHKAGSLQDGFIL